MCWLRALTVWLILMGAEVIHGMLRTIFLAPIAGDFRSRQIGVFTGSLIIIAIVFLFIRWIGLWKRTSQIAVGFTWLVLTLVFEISLGRFVIGSSWDRIGADFNVFRGGLLPIGLLILFLSPLIAARLRKIQR
jgi:hypothetical protein